MSETAGNRRILLLIGLVLIAAIPTAAALWLAGGGDDRQNLLVLAPSSLAPVEDELDAALERAGIGEVDWIFSGSQSLVAQVADGAPADVVLTADRISFDAARMAGADHPTEVAFAANHLVLAVADGNPGAVVGLEALSDDDLLIGLCAPEVPCGRLTEAALLRFNTAARPDTEETSVRALTTKLVTGELDAGLIYHSDAEAEGLTVIEIEGLDELTNTYWGTATEDGVPILELLTSDEGQAIFAAAGFQP